MNIFRLVGDMTHLASVLVLLLKIHTIKSCAGVSLKTQELYALVFAARYLDLFTHYVSLYNTLMKIIFLVSSFSIVWYMRRHKIVRRSYDKEQDTFRHYFLIVPCVLLALVINEKFTFKEVMWAFSLYLEAVAILPQLVLLQRTRNIDNLTGQYVFLLGAYRAFYILNWIYRYFTQPHFVHWICILSLSLSRLLYVCVISNVDDVYKLVIKPNCSYHSVRRKYWFPKLIPTLRSYSCLALQLGFQGLSRPCSMLISFITTSKAGRITQSLNCLLEVCVRALLFISTSKDSVEEDSNWNVVLVLVLVLLILCCTAALLHPDKMIYLFIRFSRS